MSDAPVTLITGTRKGIGKHLAEHFLSLGHRVVGCSRQDTEWARDNRHRENYFHANLDVSDEAAVKALMTEITKRHGRLDHLINNAAKRSTVSVPWTM